MLGLVQWGANQGQDSKPGLGGQNIAREVKGGEGVARIRYSKPKEQYTKSMFFRQRKMKQEGVSEEMRRKDWEGTRRIRTRYQEL